MSWCLKLIDSASGTTKKHLTVHLLNLLGTKSLCLVAKANTFADIKELMLLEDFKGNLPDRIVVHLNEQKLAKAAVLADEYTLTQDCLWCTTFWRPDDYVISSSFRSFFSLTTLSLFMKSVNVFTVTKRITWLRTAQFWKINRNSPSHRPQKWKVWV